MRARSAFRPRRFLRYSPAAQLLHLPPFIRLDQCLSAHIRRAKPCSAEPVSRSATEPGSASLLLNQSAASGAASPESAVWHKYKAFPRREVSVESWITRSAFLP